MEKKGQFYLITALIIISILLGVNIIYNSAKPQKEDVILYDLSEEVNAEVKAVVDMGIIQQGINEGETLSRIKAIVGNLSTSDKAANFTIIFGNANSIQGFVYYYQGICIGTGTGGDPSCVESLFSKSRELDSEELNSYNGKIELITSADQQKKISFDLKPGQNFYIVATKEDTVITQ